MPEAHDGIVDGKDASPERAEVRSHLLGEGIAEAAEPHPGGRAARPLSGVREQEIWRASDDQVRGIAAQCDNCSAREACPQMLPSPPRPRSRTPFTKSRAPPEFSPKGVSAVSPLVPSMDHDAQSRGVGRWIYRGRGTTAIVVAVVLIGVVAGLGARGAPGVRIQAPQSGPLTANFTYWYLDLTCDLNGTIQGQVDLSASASGGAPPYSYHWTLPNSQATGMNITESLFQGTVVLAVEDAAGNNTTHSAYIPAVALPCATSSGSVLPEYLLGVGVILAVIIALVVILRKTGNPPPPRG
jgi:hypothetical protein